jgi:hypothetical protein
MEYVYIEHTWTVFRVEGFVLNRLSASMDV